MVLDIRIAVALEGGVGPWVPFLGLVPALGENPLTLHLWIVCFTEITGQRLRGRRERAGEGGCSADVRAWGTACPPAW